MPSVNKYSATGLGSALEVRVLPRDKGELEAQTIRIPKGAAMVVTLTSGMRSPYPPLPADESLEVVVEIRDPNNRVTKRLQG